VELLRLRELVDAALQQFLIGPQIRELIGVRRRKTGQQRDRGSHTA
jgi:succinylarginine dihydrolase